MRPNKNLTILFLFFVISVLRFAVAQEINVEEVKNASYRYQYGGVFKFADGQYDKGNPQFESAGLDLDHVSFSDVKINGRITKAAAIVFWVSRNGSAAFYNLAILINQNGQPYNITTQYLGTKIDVLQLYSQGNKFTLITSDHLSDSNSTKKQIVFRLNNEHLNFVSSKIFNEASNQSVVHSPAQLSTQLPDTQSSIPNQESEPITSVSPSDQPLVQDNFNGIPERNNLPQVSSQTSYDLQKRFSQNQKQFKGVFLFLIALFILGSLPKSSRKYFFIFLQFSWRLIGTIFELLIRMIQSLTGKKIQEPSSLDPAYSRSISKEVRREVWRRDQGRCVQCKSQERLEYDHIIPFSKGGGATARNIQLLCEGCNRVKSSQI